MTALKQRMLEDLRIRNYAPPSSTGFGVAHIGIAEIPCARIASSKRSAASAAFPSSSRRIPSSYAALASGESAGAVGLELVLVWSLGSGGALTVPTAGADESGKVPRAYRPRLFVTRNGPAK